MASSSSSSVTFQFSSSSSITSKFSSSSYSSSSSSLTSEFSSQGKLEFQEKYDVFISFRGEDTRNGFASYLYAALSANQISTFMDHQLNRGEEISHTLRKAIEESKIWIIIFSENYAWSTWCLDELVQILECKKRNQQSVVIPIFYGIDPCAVRKQRGSYGAAFAELEERFKDRIEKVHQWKAALTEASNLCGFDSKQFRPESKLVEKIVEDITSKLPNHLPNEHFCGDHLIGIRKKVLEVELLLSIGSTDVCIVGFWGMGGIGKTTLASVVYQKLFTQFEGCCFLWNVREEYERNGPNHLRKKLLSELLNDEAIQRMDTPFVASPFVLHRLRRKRILIVLDDVDTSTQLENLVEGYDRQLAPGSRIIVTARNLQVLNRVANRFYKVEELNYMESLTLFELHAFGKNSPAMDYHMLSKRVASYANGNPLALKVLGSFLHSKSKEEWEIALNKLKIVLNSEILDVLRISYDGLDKGTKSIFLDIACMFDQSSSRGHVESILDANESFVKMGIIDLIDRSLIENKTGNLLWMHGLIRKMGQTIVCDEEPGSRLWDANEICHMLERNTGAEKVEGISLNMCTINRDVKVYRAAFCKMYNLRILKIYICHSISDKKNICDNMNKFNLYLPHGLDSCLSKKLHYLQWDLYPLKSLSSYFILENLVEMILRGSHLHQLWYHEVQALPVLKKIDLSYSKLLTKIPDLSVAPYLENLNLEGCTSLVHVLSSVQNLHKLAYLNLSGCSKLRDLSWISRSTGLLKFTCLKSFVQWFTSNLYISFSHANISQNFPMNLRYLNLNGTEIEAVPPSIAYLSGLVGLSLKFCKRLKSLPDTICKLRSLESLCLYGCGKLDEFPEILERMEYLTHLTLDFTGIKVLPESIENLVSLKFLHISSCRDLEFLPNSLCSLRKLECIYLMCCSKLKKLPPLPPDLHNVELDGCESLRSLAELPSLGIRLSARGCTSLENISSWRAPLNFRFMVGQVDFDGCDKLDHNTRNSILADCVIFQILYHLKYEGNLLYNPCINVCKFPNYYKGEIPKWFNYQACGTSINVTLPPYWNNDDFLGFAFRLQFQNITVPTIPLVIVCTLKFKTINDNRLYEYPDIIVLPRKKPSDDVYTCCVSNWNLRCSEEMKGLDWPSTCSTEASLDVRLIEDFCVYSRWKELGNLGNNKYVKIKKIGIWFVYNEDIERFEAETRSKRPFKEYCEASGSEEVNIGTKRNVRFCWNTWKRFDAESNSNRVRKLDEYREATESCEIVGYHEEDADTEFHPAKKFKFW